jgi:sodium/bile acid cotransporter 7
VQSSIAYTSMARGNVGASVASAAMSNLLGIVLTPLLLGVLVHAQSTGINFSGVWKIVLQLLLPFALGHALRPWLGRWAARQKAILTYTDRATIVLAIYSAFSAAVLGGLWHQMPVGRLLVLAAICAALLGLMLLGARTAARALGFDADDEIPILFCGVQKSLVSGVPMARVLFAGPAVGTAVLPVMIYHQMQLMTCAWLARRYAARAGAKPEDHE